MRSFVQLRPGVCRWPLGSDLPALPALPALPVLPVLPPRERRGRGCRRSSLVQGAEEGADVVDEQVEDLDGGK
ncbi:hypothetical protein ACFYPT_11190 [Streptomyces sp. NPDC005529]|uniref:hypothetical protein n=1 Tax=unclassified Streptomyces TaxID=2593676 RepID=UPI0033AD275B